LIVKLQHEHVSDIAAGQGRRLGTLVHLVTDNVSHPSNGKVDVGPAYRLQRAGNVGLILLAVEKSANQTPFIVDFIVVNSVDVSSRFQEMAAGDVVRVVIAECK